ncbi:MAG: hypothetical protein OXC83_10060 [Chloroflexi bacterium]|nr:hypothetical protein [Chloroflexota bacterium]
MAHPNDIIREQILQYFYDRNANATSQKGKKGSEVKISDIKRELKNRHGLTQQQVISNLNYLIDSGWVAKKVDNRSFRTRAGTEIPSQREWYSITSVGIDRIEEQSSEFVKPSPYANINISASNSVVQLGDGNVVNKSYVGLFDDLNALSDEITSSDLDDEDKVSSIADIETIKNQLAKPEPDKSIIGMALDSLKNGATGKVISGIPKIVDSLEPLFQTVT